MSVDRILVIDDDPISCEYVYEALLHCNYDVDVAADGEQGVEMAKKKEYDLVFTDMKMPGMDGVQVVETIKEISPDTIFVIMTAYGTIESAVGAIRRGAFDYIIKPFSPDQLSLVVKRVEDRQKMLNENKYWRSNSIKSGSGKLIFSSNSLMNDLYKQVLQVARSKASVLVQGESGTGKELIAHAIHMNSPRHNKPFIKVNCAALTETLLESELFGHEKGSFTGAISKREGRFELANEGTLLLDEITEISPSVQSKLLRVLEEEEFERVGGTKTIKVDVRIIATTNRDIVDEIKQGNFRQDLFYRLNVIPQYVPPLRERREDIPLLVDYFFNKYKKEGQGKVKSISKEALTALCEYRWPGNIRELKNMVQRAVLMADVEQIGPGHFFNGYRTVEVEEKESVKSQIGQSIEDMERDLILHTLRYTSDNKEQAAKILKVTTRTLRNKLHKYGSENDFVVSNY
ncbi:MAG: sigma-54-dependent transcriptional regulator [Candidatus Anammoxibacter sp.]